MRSLQNEPDTKHKLSKAAARKSDTSKKQEAFDVVRETVEALIAERGEEEKLWGSMVKQALKRRKPTLGAAIAAPYVVGLGVATAQTAREVDAEARPYVAPAFLAMHVGWGLGFWQRVFQVAVSKLPTKASAG